MAVVAAACALGVAPAEAATPMAADPADLLRASGLTRIGRVWVAPLEVELRRDLADLPSRREKIIRLDRDLDERIAVNRRTWQASQPTIAALKQSRSRLGTDDPLRESIERQIDALRAAAPEPAKLSARREVRARVVQWASERNALAAALSRIKSAVPQLKELYDRLAQTRELAEAIERLEGGQRIGPQRSYQADLDRLDEYDRYAFAPWTPAYWVGKHLRFTVLYADQAPITFAWIESGSEPTVITHTAAEAAGISVPGDSEWQSLVLDTTRTVRARRIIASRLRIGNVLLRDVPVLVLPPEAEDWGCRIGQAGLAGHQVRLDPERLRLWIDAG
jgi:hypothetical protein